MSHPTLVTPCLFLVSLDIFSKLHSNDVKWSSTDLKSFRMSSQAATTFCLNSQLFIPTLIFYTIKQFHFNKTITNPPLEQHHTKSEGVLNGCWWAVNDERVGSDTAYRIGLIQIELTWEAWRAKSRGYWNEVNQCLPFQFGVVTVKCEILKI